MDIMICIVHLTGVFCVSAMLFIFFFSLLQVALGNSQAKNPNAYAFDSELKDTDFRSRIVEGFKQPDPDFTVAMPGGTQTAL